MIRAPDAPSGWLSAIAPPCTLSFSRGILNSFSTAQVNYMAVISLDLGIMAVQGEPVPSYVDVPLPEITDENVCEWADEELPDDWYAIPAVPGPAEVQEIIANALAAEVGGSPVPSPELSPVATPAG